MANSIMIHDKSASPMKASVALRALSPNAAPYAMLELEFPAGNLGVTVFSDFGSAAITRFADTLARAARELKALADARGEG